MSDTSGSIRETMAPEARKLCWYAVHTYSGYENKVMDTLRKSVENSDKPGESEGADTGEPAAVKARGNTPLKDLILDIRVPMEEYVEIHNGKRVVKQRKMYPGYVLIHMIWTTESWYVVRNTRGVTGFVGPESKPVALSDEEVERMLNPPPAEVSTDIKVGDTVTILDGAFNGRTGNVSEIRTDDGVVIVQIPMFGRPTDVEVELDKVEKVVET